MPDISMCPGSGCQFKHDCYRYVAEATPGRQSFFMQTPLDIKTMKCEYFMQLWPLSAPKSLSKTKQLERALGGKWSYDGYTRWECDDGRYVARTAPPAPFDDETSSVKRYYLYFPEKGRRARRIEFSGYSPQILFPSLY